MNQHSLKRRESLFSAASAGFFFILVGAIFTYSALVSEINLFDKIVAFFRDFEIAKVPNSEILVLPKPEFPRAHLDVYSAAFRFSMIWGFYQIAILVVRLIAGSPTTRKAETSANLVFWLGTSYLISTALIENMNWFVFWAQVIMLIGVSLIVRAAILVFRR